MQPLAHITIVSLEQAVAAPFASRQLADLGARVIKIERPGTGDFARGYDATVRGMSSHFVWINRSKESLTLNLKLETGKIILEKLLAQADVFLHNLAPGAVARLGFDQQRLRVAYPGLIICHISGYGATGPYRDKKAYDMLIQAEAGLLAITGTEESPAKAGIPVADIAAGVVAFSAIQTALIARGYTGEGTVIEISMLEALAEWMGFPSYYTMGGTAPGRHGAKHAAIAPYGPFISGDGQVIMLGIQNEREWRLFCENVLEQPDLALDPRFNNNSLRVANRPALRKIISDLFAQLTKEQALARLDHSKIANAEMRTVPSFLDHPQLLARQRWQQVDSPVGPIPALRPAATFENVEPRLDPIPALGQHTEAILTQLGYDDEQTSQLRKSGVI
ncbi:MAG: CoA transferase [Anaerolineaceae bacterium]|nr:MAG: CoA transferase [Anaerolineaceae bacterium]